MNYKETLRYIDSFALFGSVLGLDRLIELLKRMGNPQKKLKFVHVAGTNGKGSTTTMLSNILIKSGYKTGLFISPYVLCFRERMQIDGCMISEDDLCSCTGFVKKHVEKMRGDSLVITQFELETAIAFEWYSRQGCDIVCLEVGLGGRFDATNVIDCPLVHVITAIDYDHTAILGDSISKIAFEKAGIIKGSSTVIYPLQQDDAKQVIVNCCEKAGSVPVIVDLSTLEITDKSWMAFNFDYDGLSFEKSLPGLFQVYNAATAYTAALQLRECGYTITDDQIIYGIKDTFFPARTEILSRFPLVVLDGAHNISGAQELAKTLKGITGDKIILMIGLLSDKDYDKILEILLPFADMAILLTPNNPRALMATQLADIAKKYCNCCLSFDDYNLAVDYVFSVATENDAIVACGSLYLASDIRPLLIDKTR